MPPSPLATLLGPALGQSRGRLALAAAGLGLAQACFLLLPLQLKPLAAALDSSASAAESRRLLRTGCSRMVGEWPTEGGCHRRLPAARADRRTQRCTSSGLCSTTAASTASTALVTARS